MLNNRRENRQAARNFNRCRGQISVEAIVVPGWEALSVGYKWTQMLKHPCRKRGNRIVLLPICTHHHCCMPTAGWGRRIREGSNVSLQASTQQLYASS